ncbi:TetR/AcrR family transcriptional regulator [Pseudonocardia halophobica]|uniref:TetR family transcriptional regulator n=1 Tax=Pseudonocardia halophobica TaxID=29401 RepID=A0A9W6L8V2_9PSEU|nr:TetR/AcrR family transcriptional regulator [Pseudonocardia halophobica]GLL15067.1 TetR family transcriptional regulator [Pseudonocardia halophobica]
MARAHQPATRPPNAPPGDAAILEASIATMAEHGYHGTSVRDIALRAGLSPAALYHHFPSKQAVLAMIMERGIEALLTRTREALERAGDEPADQLRALVEVQVLFHLEDQRGTLLGTSELRALEEPVRTPHLAKRHAQQRMFDEVVARGVELGAFRTPLPNEASRAIVVMCTGVASWFSPEGPASPEEMVGRYQRLALDMVDAVDPGPWDRPPA